MLITFFKVLAVLLIAVFFFKFLFIIGKGFAICVIIAICIAVIRKGQVRHVYPK